MPDLAPIGAIPRPGAAAESILPARSHDLAIDIDLASTPIAIERANEESMMDVPDILVDRPRILFVGINPGRRSGEIGHHFAGLGNPFWRLLHASKLTPELLMPETERRLIELRLALTNLCPRTTRAAAELAREELLAGREALLRKVESLRPETIALVGVGLYRIVVPGGGGRGPGPMPEIIGGARLFVLPNPSGRNASHPGFKDKLRWFEALRAFAESNRC